MGGDGGAHGALSPPDLELQPPLFLTESAQDHQHNTGRGGGGHGLVHTFTSDVKSGLWEKSSKDGEREQANIWDKSAVHRRTISGC